jgi:hypothetical protein
VPSSPLLDKIYPKVITRKKTPEERVREAVQKSLDSMVSDLEKYVKEREGERGDGSGE